MLHLPKVLSVAEMQVSVCEQIPSCTYLTADKTQGPLEEIPVSYPATTKSEINIYLGVITSMAIHN